MEKIQNDYETICVMSPKLTEDTVGKEIEKSVDIIQKFGGSVQRTENWGLRKLCYEMKKESKGIYTYIRYKSETGAVKELDRVFKINDDILKHLTVKLEKSRLTKEKRKLSQGLAKQETA